MQNRVSVETSTLHVLCMNQHIRHLLQNNLTLLASEKWRYQNLKTIIHKNEDPHGVVV